MDVAFALNCRRLLICYGFLYTSPSRHNDRVFDQGCKTTLNFRWGGGKMIVICCCTYLEEFPGGGNCPACPLPVAGLDSTTASYSLFYKHKKTGRPNEDSPWKISKFFNPLPLKTRVASWFRWKTSLHHFKPWQETLATAIFCTNERTKSEYKANE